MDARGGVGGSGEPHELPDDREVPRVLRVWRDRLERRIQRQELGPEKVPATICLEIPACGRDRIACGDRQMVAGTVFLP